MSDRSTATQSVHVYPACALRALSMDSSNGTRQRHVKLRINENYALDHDFAGGRLSLQADPLGAWCVAANTGIGRPGARLRLDSALTFMSPNGQTKEAVLVQERDDLDQVSTSYLVPLSGLSPRVTYALVGIDPDGARDALSRVPCLHFARGTRIALASGHERRIEELQVGDKVLTHDAGPQEIRWIGGSIMPSSDHLAPVIVKAGALGNAHDLIISPNHRLYVSPHKDGCGTGGDDLMVKARHLINEDTVRILPGTSVGFIQILFDRHHPILAEGIAAEATLLDLRRKPSLPPDLLDKLTRVMPGDLGSTRRKGDVQQALMNRADAFDLLRQVSMQ